MPFWPFVRPIRVEPLTPEQLQTRLVDAAYAGNRYLKRFCRAYRDQVVRREPCAYSSACVPWVTAAPARRAAATMIDSAISSSVQPAVRARLAWISMQ